MQNIYTIVCNWKMYVTYEHTKQWLATYGTQLSTLVKNNSIIICPSFESLDLWKPYSNNTTVFLGAQTCSAYEKGAYTGQVAAHSLKELGCTYCIIGHSETRKYSHENNEIITQKFLQLIECSINPILCIGETAEEYNQQKTYVILKEQLKPLSSLYNQLTQKKLLLYIAYEPRWAIDAQNAADTPYLNDIFNFLYQELLAFQYTPQEFQLLYGGSVNSKNSISLKSVAHVQGFLLGRAGTDFEELKKIVL